MKFSGELVERGGRRPPRRPAIGGLAALVTLVVALIYLALPSRNFNGDGLGYAYQVESGSSNELWSISGRLLYCPVGRVIHSSMAKVGLETRSIYVMRAMNSVFGAIAAGIFTLLVYRLTNSRRLAIIAAFGLAFSLATWFWSVNVTSYPGYILFLVLSLSILLKLPDTTGSRGYYGRAALLGATFALTCYFWLTGIILAPAIFFIVMLAPRVFRIGERLVAGIVHAAVFAALFLLPIIIAAIYAAGVTELPGFFDWLAAGAHTSRPELTVANFMRGIIGFSSSLFHIVLLGPWVKQLVFDVPYVVDDSTRLAFEAGAFLLIWLVAGGVAVLLVRRWTAVRPAYGRIPVLLLGWSVIPLIWGLTWGGADSQRWLVVLPVFWLLLSLIVARQLSGDRGQGHGPTIAAFAAFVCVMAAYNLVWAIYPDSDPSTNRHYRIAREFNPHLDSADLLLLWGNDHAFTGADLWYFFGKSSMDLTIEGNKFWDTFETHLYSRIGRARERDGRVYVSGRVFLEHDRPESRYSEAEQTVQRPEVAEMLSKWPRRPAFVQGGDTYYQLVLDDSTTIVAE